MLTLIALSVLLQELPAPPAPPEPPLEVRARFIFMGDQEAGTLDADGDGQVTREEFRAPLEGAFDRLDTDGDGRLSTAELETDPGPGDGEIRVRRGPGGPEGRRIEFRRSGHDGEPFGRSSGPTVLFLSGEPGPGGEREFVLHADGSGLHVIHPDGAEGSHDVRIAFRRPGGPEGGPEGGRDLDRDGDGKVSELEFTAPLREAFARMDADRSGFVEDGERGAGPGVRLFTHRIEPRVEE